MAIAGGSDGLLGHSGDVVRWRGGTEVGWLPHCLSSQRLSPTAKAAADAEAEQHQRAVLQMRANAAAGMAALDGSGGGDRGDDTGAASGGTHSGVDDVLSPVRGPQCLAMLQPCSSHAPLAAPLQFYPPQNPSTAKVFLEMSIIDF